MRKLRWRSARRSRCWAILTQELRVCAMGLGSVPATGGWDFGAGRLGCFCCVPTERGKHWKRRLWLHDVIRGFIYRRSLKPWRRRRWDGPNSPGQRSWLRGASDRTLRGKRSNALTDAAPLEPCQTFGTPIRQLASTKCSPEVAYWPNSDFARCPLVGRHMGDSRQTFLGPAETRSTVTASASTQFEIAEMKSLPYVEV